VFEQTTEEIMVWILITVLCLAASAQIILAVVAVKSARKAVLAELREFAARGSFYDYDRRKIELAFLREFEATHKAKTEA
jgi:hypothetical protein